MSCNGDSKAKESSAGANPNLDMPDSLWYMKRTNRTSDSTTWDEPAAKTMTATATATKVAAACPEPDQVVFTGTARPWPRGRRLTLVRQDAQGRDLGQIGWGIWMGCEWALTSVSGRVGEG